MWNPCIWPRDTVPSIEIRYCSNIPDSCCGTEFDVALRIDISTVGRRDNSPKETKKRKQQYFQEPNLRYLGYGALCVYARVPCAFCSFGKFDRHPNSLFILSRVYHDWLTRIVEAVTKL